MPSRNSTCKNLPTCMHTVPFVFKPFSTRISSRHIRKNPYPSLLPTFWQKLSGHRRIKDYNKLFKLKISSSRLIISLIIARTKASSLMCKIIHPYSIEALMSCLFDLNHQIYKKIIKIMVFPSYPVLVQSCPNPGISPQELLLKISTKMGKSLNNILQSWAIQPKIKN